MSGPPTSMEAPLSTLCFEFLSELSANISIGVFKVNTNGAPIFIHRSHLYIVFPKILEVMANMDDQHAIFKQAFEENQNAFMNQLAKMRIFEKSPTGKIQRYFRFTRRKNPPNFEPIGNQSYIRGLIMPTKNLNSDYLENILSQKPMNIIRLYK